MQFEKIKKTNQIFIFAALLFAGLYYGASLLVPFTFAVFFAALILPVVQWLERNTRSAKLLSSFVGTFLIFLGVGILIFFFIQQLGVFLQDIIESQEQILTYLRSAQVKAAEITGFSLKQQDKLLEESVMQILNVTQSYVSGFLTGVTGLLLNFLLVLILMFLVLLNRTKFEKFLMMYVKPERQEETQNIITEAGKVAYKYLWGRLQVMTILSIMYLILFLAYDLKHTGLLILFGALITIIPYIGPFISGTLPILFLIIFGGSSGEIISFTIIIAIIQLIESYVLEPVIIGSEVEQSPLFIILAIILGGILWGPAGFILFVPIFSIIKILFDHTKGLEPVGYLLGNERPNSKRNIFTKLQKKFRK
ncbi:AI-2E family transporter [Salinimicrobium terrae]|uniref:AI-2E family transporter n=1 Tax=Salinimicrobium terrae TaxID=470866 RepID=UPI0004139462|nr:AI-2E family transporter [Salinimicrobium terrae]